MKRILITAAALFSLTACSLEVEQHPAWIDGKYNGKKDDLPPRAYFHNDRLAWNAMINNRNHFQNEYGRTRP